MQMSNPILKWTQDFWREKQSLSLLLHTPITIKKIRRGEDDKAEEENVAGGKTQGGDRYIFSKDKYGGDPVRGQGDRIHPPRRKHSIILDRNFDQWGGRAGRGGGYQIVGGGREFGEGRHPKWDGCSREGTV